MAWTAAAHHPDDLEIWSMEHRMVCIRGSFLVGRNARIGCKEATFVDESDVLIA